MTDKEFIAQLLEQVIILTTRVKELELRLSKYEHPKNSGNSSVAPSHSFGNIAGESIHPLMLQKLYRHSDLKTTINYQANFIHKEADDALDSVINF